MLFDYTSQISFYLFFPVQIFIKVSKEKRVKITRHYFCKSLGFFLRHICFSFFSVSAGESYVCMHIGVLRLIA